MSNYWEGFICPICGEGFTLAQWEVRHNGDNGEEYHEDCCPECNEHPTDCTCDDCADVLRSAGYTLLGDDEDEDEYCGNCGALRPDCKCNDEQDNFYDDDPYGDLSL